MKTIDGKFVCNWSEDSPNWESEVYYDTKEEAIQAALEAVNKFNNDADPDNAVLDDCLGDYPYANKLASFAVGQVNVPRCFNVADEIVEMIQQQAYDTCVEASDGYLSDVEQEHLDELDQLVTDWLERHSYIPDFYAVENVEVIQVEEIE